MKELLNNALLGWGNYNYNGKFAALLFLTLLYFFLRKGEDEQWNEEQWKEKPKGKREKTKRYIFLVYTVVMVTCCACPVTAALLMCYQTRFYDFQWIMNYVPVTMVIALGAAVFLGDQWRRLLKRDSRKKAAQRQEPRKQDVQKTGKGGVAEKLLRNHEWNKRMQMAGVVFLLLLLVVLCGRMGQPILNPQTEEPVFDARIQRLKREGVRSILAELAESAESGHGSSEEELCLWAPQAVMASARAKQPELHLIYGRNMWDAALGAYTYETYGEVEEKLYQWMCYVEDHGTLDAVTAEGNVIEGVNCVEDAVAAGVNRILLPAKLQAEAVQALEAVLGVSAQKLEEYYLFVL